MFISHFRGLLGLRMHSRKVKTTIHVFIMKECYYHCTKMQLFCFPFFLSFFDFFPESGIRKEEARTSVHPFPEVPLLFWRRLHPSTLISISDPLSPAPGSLASCHSSSAFRSSFYLFPGVLDCIGSYWCLES